MPFDDPWDESTPTAGESARDGDDRIREFKRAVRERLKTFFPFFDTNDPGIDETLPLVVRAGAVKKVALDEATLLTRLAVTWGDASSMDPQQLQGEQFIGVPGMLPIDTVIVKQNPINTGIFMYAAEVTTDGFYLRAILSNANTPDGTVEFTVIRPLMEDP